MKPQKIGHLGSNTQEAFYNTEDLWKQYEIIDTTSDVDNSDYVDDYDFDSALTKALEILKSGLKDIPLRPSSPVPKIDNVIEDESSLQADLKRPASLDKVILVREWLKEVDGKIRLERTETR